MSHARSYRRTLAACYLGFVTQAIAANFAPLLFITFSKNYGLGFDRLALIPLVFYFTQLLVDCAAARFADKIGYRLCVVASQLLSAPPLCGHFGGGGALRRGQRAGRGAGKPHSRGLPV